MKKDGNRSHPPTEATETLGLCIREWFNKSEESLDIYRSVSFTCYYFGYGAEMALNYWSFRIK